MDDLMQRCGENCPICEDVGCIFHEMRKEERRLKEEMIQKKKDLFVWTKRLGQRHYARNDGFTHETLCGIPMLGNNYANVIPEREQKECEECIKALRRN